MKKSLNILLKGSLIFGILGFALFIILIVLGMVMSALGFSCNCYEIFAWSLIGVGIATSLLMWFGCCCEDGNCK